MPTIRMNVEEKTIRKLVWRNFGTNHDPLPCMVVVGRGGSRTHANHAREPKNHDRIKNIAREKKKNKRM